MVKEYIEQRDGGYYISGTRVSLDSIVYAFTRGESPETISQNVEVLVLEGVYGAIAYYLANQAAIDAYLTRQDKKWAAGKRNPELLPTELRAKLMRAGEQMHASRIFRSGALKAGKGSLLHRLPRLANSDRRRRVAR